MQTRNNNSLVSRQNKRKLKKTKEAIGKKISSYYGNFTRLFANEFKYQQQDFNILPAITGAYFERQNDEIMRRKFSLNDYINLGRTNKNNYANFKRYLSENQSLNHNIEFVRRNYKSMQIETEYLRSKQMHEYVSLLYSMYLIIAPLAIINKFADNYDGPFYPLLQLLAIVLGGYMVILVTRQMLAEEREQFAKKKQQFNKYHHQLRLFSQKTIDECTYAARSKCFDELSILTPHTIKLD